MPPEVVMVADPARLAAAQRMLTRLGLGVADLHDDDPPRRLRVPTIGEYLPR
jgi:hypothetical protein